MRRERSIGPDYFEALYRDDPDPWRFETSAYEAEKYARTLAALPGAAIPEMLEIGCSIGVLTEQLAPHCGRLVAVDVSETALAAARRRCAALANVDFQRRQLPDEAPDGVFDLILLSEVVYYWDQADLVRLAAWLRQATRRGGHLLLVHWTGETDYPQSGDAAVTALAALLGDGIAVVEATRHGSYRLDLWRWSGGAGER